MRLSMLLIILGMAVATYLTRGPLLAFGKRIAFPPLFLRSLRYVPVAMMAAIVFPAVLAPQGRVVPSPLNPYLLAALATAAVVKLTRSSAAGILVGLAVMVAMRMWG